MSSDPRSAKQKAESERIRLSLGILTDDERAKIHASVQKSLNAMYEREAKGAPLFPLDD